MFEKKVYNQLLKWKNETHGTKAILIEGARRIGKSTVAEEFAKKNYKSYIIIDFSKVTPTIIKAFNNFLDNLDSFLCCCLWNIIHLFI